MEYKKGASMLPQHMQRGFIDYIETGAPPGDFLTAVICNDLRGAFGQADNINFYLIGDFVSAFHNFAPAMCWGSNEAFMHWQQAGGLKGKGLLDNG